MRVPFRRQPLELVRGLHPWWRWLLLCLLVWACGPTPTAWAEAVAPPPAPTQAKAPAGLHLLTEAQALPAERAASGDWHAAPRVTLPDDWAATWPGQSGERWYRLQLPPVPDRPEPGEHPTAGAQAPPDLYGLYVERACSVLAVSVNGQRVLQGGRFEAPESRNCHRPQLAAVPAALLKAGDNEVRLQVKGHALQEVSGRQGAGGLSAVMFGPYALLAEHHDRRSAYAVQLPQVFSGTLLLLGSFMFVLGSFNRAQSYLAYFGALMLGWSLLLARLWVSDLPLPHQAVEAGLSLLSGLLTWAAVQFLLRYAGERLRWLDRALPVQTLLMGLSLALVPADRLHLLSLGWNVVLGAELVMAAVHHLASERRQHSPQFWPMLGLMLAVTVALVVDGLAANGPLDPAAGYAAQLVPALVFILLGLRLVQQFGRAFLTSEQHRAELEVRIREATAQIERNFAQLAELKVEQVTDRERKRIAADLHDDLGAKLLTIVHTSDNERISTLAREALEEMRLSVRGLTGKPVKLVDALGDWRAEVVSRLAQSGVQSEWQAPGDDDELPLTLSSRAYVQTTRILREAVSNIIKHSGASHCIITCSLQDGDFQCVIQDNGRGISMETDGRLDKGHGMASMKGRAKQLHGQCLVESSPGYGTVIRLTLPLEPLLTSP